MHPVQQAYYEAKNAYDTACAVHTAELLASDFFTLLEKSSENGLSDDVRIASIEEEAESVSHYLDRSEDLYIAEKTLLAWAEQETLTAQRAYDSKPERAMIQELFANIHKHPMIKMKLIATIMKMDATVSVTLP